MGETPRTALLATRRTVCGAYFPRRRRHGYRGARSWRRPGADAAGDARWVCVGAVVRQIWVAAAMAARATACGYAIDRVPGRVFLCRVVDDGNWCDRGMALGCDFS